MKQLRAGALAGIDQGADVGIARRNHAIEGRQHVLEGFQFAQPRHVGRRRVSRGLLGRRIPGLLVGVLLGHRIGGEQSLPTDIGALRQGFIGARGGQIRLRLAQLLIDLRSLDLGEQLSLDDSRSDVRVPGLQIAAGACVDRRFDEGRDGSRQYQAVAQIAARGSHRDHRRHRGLRGLAAQGAPCQHPADFAPDAERDGDEEQQHAVAEHALLERRVLGARGGLRHWKSPQGNRRRCVRG